MGNPPIHGKRPTLTASRILAAAGDDLAQIKKEDGLTYQDMGRILGKSEDQVAKYCDGSAEMGIVAYTFARREWNGRFTGSLDNLVTGATDESCDRSKASHIARANYELTVALEDDGEVTPSEVRRMRKSLEAARDAIDELLRKLTVRAA